MSTTEVSEKEAKAAAKKEAAEKAKAAKQAEREAKAVAKNEANAKLKAEKEAAKAAKLAAKEAAKAAKAAKVAEKEALKSQNIMPQQNSIRHPKPNTKTGKAWDLFDELSTKKGSPISIAEVKDEIKTRGLVMNENMTKSQYAYWRKYNGVSGRVV